MNEIVDQRLLITNSSEDLPSLEDLCLDLDKKYKLNELLNHLKFNFKFNFCEVLSQQFDLNTLSGVINLKIVVELKKASDEEMVEEKENNEENKSPERKKNKLKISEDIPIVRIEEKKEEEEEGSELVKQEVRVSRPLCELCGMVFHQQKTYARHMWTEHKQALPTFTPLPKSFNCSKCNMNFPARHLLQKHEMEHRGFYFRCSRCHPSSPHSFPSYTQLRTHYLKQHLVLKCKTCQEICFGRSGYSDHQSQAHSDSKAEKSKSENKLICSTCGRLFHHSTKLSEHMMFSKGGRCFVCPLCDKSMKSRKCLKYHMTLHGVGARKQCQFCDHTFAQNSALVQHIRMNHPEKLPDKYKGDVECGFCGKKFPSRTSLISHKMTSHEQEMIKCPKCNRKFTSSTALNNHLHHCA